MHNAQMRPNSQPVRAALAARLTHLVLNWLAFAVCYPLGNRLADGQQVRRSLALTLDTAIPFVPWTIVPYATSGLFFTLVFFLVRTPEQLRVVSRRLLATTILGVLIFAAFPARFSLARPVLEGWPAWLYAGLDLVDQPYNQFPSLHVAYCVIFWLALAPLTRGPVRAALAAWLLLIVASTMLTWQHHLVDVVGGVVLGLLATVLIRPGRTRRHTVAFCYAAGAGIVLLAGAWALRSWLLGYVAVSLAMIAVAYWRRDAGFLRKQDGRHPLTSWLLYWPYLLGYRLTWAAVLWRERRRPPFVRHDAGLWVGRRLTPAEARQLPPECWVIDLSCELPETPTLRNARYRHVPLLDLQAPRPAQVRAVLRLLAERERNGYPVYLHCAMGYSRSRFIARLYQRKKSRCHSPSISSSPASSSCCAPCCPP